MLSHPFTRILVVNRGECARRLIHAVREQRIETGRDLRTVALYTDPDADSLFVREADEAMRLGPATVDDPAGGRRSAYLDLDRLERIMVASRAEAAWVGWGFVAERVAFAELCERLGVVFIGPPAAVMARLGDKIGSKRLAEQCGVPVAPWSGGPVATVDEARTWAERIGYPLLVKATAGGGGRGIRSVREPSQLAEALDRARTEARQSFGDETVFMERRIEGARHVEVQIIADSHDQVWAAGVRDCSLQRRHQKVVEEAPCPILDARQEQAIRDAAVRLAQAAGYQNAGTVELLLQPETGDFFFMEMNTRLQVEHPVTEVTTGLDLVKLQLHVASGGRLLGEPPPTVGHAIEVRLNAEDPDREFAPSPGQLRLLRMPSGPGIRVDTGVEAGDAIPGAFDSMIAKIISHGRDRAEALARLRRAIDDVAVVIEGGACNQAFLREILGQTDVQASQVDIGWLDRFSATRHLRARADADIALLQAAIEVYEAEAALELEAFLRSVARGRPRLRDEVGQPVELRLAGQAYALRVYRLSPERYHVVTDEGRVAVTVERRGAFERWLTCDGRRYHVLAQRQGAGFRIQVDGEPYLVQRDDGGVIRSPSPAMVLTVDVAVGDTIERGDRVVLLEAMKMEMAVAAPSAGVVREVLAHPNTQVAAGAPLVVLEPDVDDGPSDDAARVTFRTGRGDSTPALGDRPGKVGYRRALTALRRLLLGYDVAKASVADSSDAIEAAEREGLSDDPAIATLEDAVLDLFADVVGLYQRGSDHSAGLVPEDHLYAFVHTHSDEGRALPASVSERLERAVRHHGLESLERSPALDDALLRIHKANARARLAAAPLRRLLERRLDDAERRPEAVAPGLRPLLDRVLDATHDRFVELNDLVRQVRFRLFDQPLLEQALAQVYRRHEETMARLLQAADGIERGELVRTIVESPHPVAGFLSRWLNAEDRDVRRVILELLVRRFYNRYAIDQLETSGADMGCDVLARITLEDGPVDLFASLTDLSDLDLAIQRAEAYTRLRSRREGIVWDLFIPWEQAAAEGLSSAEVSRRFAAALGAIEADGRPERVCFCLLGVRRRADHYFTFVFDHAGPREVRQYRGMHTMWANRLELWRLANFEVEPLPTTEDVYLYRAVANDNPRDERLIAFVDVRDLTPLRVEPGVVELPHLERMYLEALDAIRAFQYRRVPHKRLMWNRIHLHLWRPLTVSIDELAHIMERLAPAARNLGLEKLVVRTRLPEPDRLDPVDTALHFGFSLDRLGRFRRSHPSRYPIRSLSRYKQTAVRLRTRGLVYPYEIIRWLTPEKAENQLVFPRGTFSEHDLDEAGGLVPIDRPYGQNTASVVVGVISNITDRHPEGMTRVIVLSDPSKAMGSLAEPECRRILAAFELAQTMGVPVEWFPVSAGAKIAMDTGTENLDWTARVLRRIIEFTAAGGEINLVVAGVNVGAQSYWNAEATMLMHTRGVLIMTPNASMVLTGKRALDYSGGVSADDNRGIGGADTVMGPNGQAQYLADDITEACQILLRHYEHTYVAPGERFPRRAQTSDPVDRDATTAPHSQEGDTGFAVVGDLFSVETNPSRKRPFDIRSVMRAVVDRDQEPLERWAPMRDAGMAVVWDAHLGGFPVALIGIESRPVPRVGFVRGDGPDTWNAGTLFPLASKKVARAINTASGNRPVVVLANLSGFDGSPESMRRLQLEYGAEIGRAVVEFEGPLVFCVISRYHGGAYVVFSKKLNANLEVAAVAGSYASVIGGAPAAAVVLTRTVNERVYQDPRVTELQAQVAEADERVAAKLEAQLKQTVATVKSEKLGEVAEEFDRTHSVERAQRVGSLDHIVEPARLRPFLIEAVERGMARVIGNE